ncbi:DUF7288 family protein [Haloarchaeobius sp. TZWWS8]|uniref:DUF7288 family protein n=1 Tax=Haloarchaeobius sp. TZWWS8 TaxID=3446121 RepID=UPI003EB8A005
MRGDERGQAYTLEGFIGAMLVLTAILFALQSVVIMPTTSGKVSRDVQEQLRVEATDVLLIAAEEESLSCQVRAWDHVNETFANSTGDPRIGYGPNPPKNVTSCDGDGTKFGAMLNQTFTEQGREYNVIVSYRNETISTKTDSLRMVYRGVPTESAVTATYTITLYDDQRVIDPNKCPSDPSNCPTLENTSNDYPIPDAAPNSPVYNVVEIRVVVW